MARILIVGILFFTVCPAVSLATTRNLDALYEKASFKIGKVNIEAYVADNDQRRSQGLMYITSLPKNTGMLFIFDQEQTLSFWMKNTVMPLNIGFFDQSGALVDIQEMQMAPSLLSLKVPTYRSRKPARFALEMESGWFAKNRIKPGARLRLVSEVKSSLLKAALSK